MEFHRSCVMRFLNSFILASFVGISGVRGGVRMNVSPTFVAGSIFSFGLLALMLGVVEGPNAGDTCLEAGTV